MNGKVGDFPAWLERALSGESGEARERIMDRLSDGANPLLRLPPDDVKWQELASLAAKVFPSCGGQTNEEKVRESLLVAAMLVRGARSVTWELSLERKLKESRRDLEIDEVNVELQMWKLFEEEVGRFPISVRSVLKFVGLDGNSAYTTIKRVVGEVRYSEFKDRGIDWRGFRELVRQWPPLVDRFEDLRKKSLALLEPGKVGNHPGADGTVPE